MSEKTKLTLNFMKKKMKEYDDLKKELENQIVKKSNEKYFIKAKFRIRFL